jgi:RNA polymerase sigma-70 factor (ECF subfamily)
MSDIEDIVVIERVLSGDTGAFSGIVEKYQGMTFRYAVSKFHDSDEALDITQEVLVAAYEALSSFRRESKFSTWFYSIMVNYCNNYRRKSGRMKTVSLNPVSSGEEYELQIPDERENPEEAVIMSDSLRIVREELMRLPEEYREILMMRDIDGLSYNEITELLNINMSNVKVRIHRGRELLKNRLYARGLV